METAYNDLPLEVERKLDMENDIEWLESELGIESGKKLDFGIKR